MYQNRKFALALNPCRGVFWDCRDAQLGIIDVIRVPISGTTHQASQNRPSLA